MFLEPKKRRRKGASPHPAALAPTPPHLPAYIRCTVCSLFCHCVCVCVCLERKSLERTNMEKRNRGRRKEKGGRPRTNADGKKTSKSVFFYCSGSECGKCVTYPARLLCLMVVREVRLVTEREAVRDPMRSNSRAHTMCWCFVCVHTPCVKYGVRNRVRK